MNKLKKNSNWSIKNKGKLQITPLKFEGVWILCFKVPKFGIYHLKFGGIWILHSNVSEFEFYPPKV